MDISFTITSLQAAGLTQAQIAAELGCSQPAVSDMATGKAGVVRPSYKVVKGLERLAEIHGVRTQSSEAPSAA